MRTIQSPGVEVNEIDRSGYYDRGNINLSKTTSFFVGFTDKGIDYQRRYVNSMSNYEHMFGPPLTEAEKYTYNGVYETLRRGGNAVVAKLPYLNGSLNKFNYIAYSVLSDLHTISGSDCSEIKKVDDTISSYMKIEAQLSSDGKIEMGEYDDLKVGNSNVGCNEIRIIDTSRGKYGCEKDDTVQDKAREYLGLLPIVTTAANAMFYQKMLDDSVQCSSYSPIKDIQGQRALSGNTEVVGYQLKGLNNDSEDVVGFDIDIGGETKGVPIDVNSDTLAKRASVMFPQLIFEDGRIERKYLKCIGIVVFKMYVDTANGNRIGFQAVESFVGSLDRKAINPQTKATMFIDTIVNTNSRLINVFTNVSFTWDSQQQLKDIDKASIFLTCGQTATSMGFYSFDTKKVISLKTSIMEALDKIFFNSENIDTFQFDLLVDAGTSNIAQFIDSVYVETRDGDKKGYYDYDLENGKFTLSSYQNTTAWRQVLQKYDNLCKVTRKDCMFIADGLRPLCIQGNQKRVRNTKPENTVEKTILKDIKWMSGNLNTSYGAGYCNWFKCIDRYSGDQYWLPPSIKVNGVYLYTDNNSAFWYAPAGMNRGWMPSDVVDCAFSPTIAEAGPIYNANWNYAVNYPINGIIVEGQRTFQKNKTALDRVNVRRLMLGLEKVVRHMAKFFNYEQNTAWLRSRFRDTIANYLQRVQTGEGILDFAVICDDTINTVQTIENNELHVIIAVKPVKSIEFICLNFIATAQGANVQEITG